MSITWLDYERISVEFFWVIFFFKIVYVSPQVQTIYWPYLKNGWSNWHEMERRCISWILCELCDLDLWPQPWPWPWIFQGQISKRCISAIVDLIDIKQKGSKWISYWADHKTYPLTTPMTLTLNLQRSKIEMAFFQNWKGQLAWNDSDRVRSFTTMSGTFVWP